MHFADALTEAVIRYHTPLCLGLDPRWNLLPDEIRRRYAPTEIGRAKAYEEFCHRVLEIAQGRVAVVKPQSAFFEACGPEGMHSLRQVIHTAQRRRFLVILDAKRGDIANTAEAYAEALYNVYHADAVTVNPYLGRDSLEPFLRYAKKSGRGVFVLVRTSNPGAHDYQDLEGGGRRLYEHVAYDVERWAEQTAGQSGFGLVGAVVGATQPEVLSRLREIMPSSLLLIPGFGAQGATAQSLSSAFLPGGRGAVVNAARSILYAAAPGDAPWETSIEKALIQASTELAKAADL